MPLLKVAPLSELQHGQVVEVAAGDRTFAVCNINGTLHCLDGTCPHAGGPLGQGTLQGEILVCPWHGYEFNCTTGENDADEDLVVDRFPVIVEEGQVLIDVPEN
jgi:nitrite reductase/ring-hydroxylating ferredoxin subunit